MPLFFFDVTDGDFIPDLIGTELPNVAAARTHAVAYAAKLLQERENAVRFWGGDEWLIEVKDDIGIILFTLVFMARDTPVSRKALAQPSGA